MNPGCCAFCIGFVLDFLAKLKQIWYKAGSGIKLYTLC